MKGNHVQSDQQMLEHAHQLLSGALGEDSPEALLNSSDRFARWQTSAFVEPRKNYNPDVPVKTYPIEENVSEIGNCIGLITIKLTAFSACEHHYAPALLKATVGYVPDKHFIGYSKLVKMFKFFACKYTQDERICNGYLNELVRQIQPKGVAILLRGKHFCVISRGGLESDFPMMSASWGVLKTDENLRREFYQHALSSWDTGI